MKTEDDDDESDETDGNKSVMAVKKRLHLD